MELLTQEVLTYVTSKACEVVQTIWNNVLWMEESENNTFRMISPNFP